MAKRLALRPSRVPTPPHMRAMYQKTLANWAFDRLSAGPAPTWPEEDPIADYNDRDWRKLYTGSVLDD